ncbi:MAG: SurA N-terminal domain-containing protein [Alphaproteobacteria bacterium]|nr:SurA N-terminal domain-containing protein [Alphaproteobacteria bacterium]
MKIRTTFTKVIFLAVLAAALPLTTTPAARAEGQGVVAVVNDRPITEYDISQRISLRKILGDQRVTKESRKKILQSLVDEQVKISEAKKYSMAPTDAEITSQIARMAKNVGNSPQQLLDRLKKQGISESTFRTYVGAQIGFNRIISAKYREDITVTPEDVDRKYAEIKRDLDAQVSKVMSDPRMKAVTVYTLMEITLPVEGDDSMLLQSRAIEAATVKQRLKGCGNVRKAAEGVFNVKAGKKIEADASKLPREMRAALDKVGPGGAVGPMRAKNGLQLLAFCGSRKLTPPKPKVEMPTREQVENVLLNEKYDSLEETYMKSARSSVYIEYRDTQYSQ